MISQLASGEIVSGAMPMPAETSDTARLRRVSNQPVTVAIIGAKNALAARPTEHAVGELEAAAAMSRDSRAPAPCPAALRRTA